MSDIMYCVSHQSPDSNLLITEWFNDKETAKRYAESIKKINNGNITKIACYKQQWSTRID